MKDPGSRLLRWRLELEQYDYEIVYKPGRQNMNAAALSRVNALQRDGSEPDEIDAGTKNKILKENHDSILGGHRGMNKTMRQLRGTNDGPI